MNYLKPESPAICSAKSRSALILALCACLCLWSGSFGATRQQTQGGSLPADLVQIDPSQIPATCRTVWSMALYPNCPPLPPGIWKSRPGTYLWSPSRQQVFLDDRAEFALQALTQSADWDTNSPLGYTGSSGIIDTNLGLLIPWASNGVACVELTNTQSGVLYNLVSHPVLGDGLSCANWASEQFVTGAPYTNVTSTSVAMADRTNLFFWAYTGANWPTNAQVFLTLQGTNALGAYVNGALGTYSAFLSTVVAIPGTVTSLNVGYDQGDDGPPQIPHFAPQNVAAITGLSDSLTALCASHNPLAAREWASSSLFPRLIKGHTTAPKTSRAPIEGSGMDMALQ